MSRALSIFVVLLLTPGAAAAEEVTPIIESRVGERPDDMDRHVSALVLGLEGGNPLGGEALARRVEQLVSLPPGAAKEPAGLRDMVQAGRRQFIEGQYKDAIRQLERARKLLRRNAALLATDQGLRNSLHKALLYLAHAYLRDGRTEGAGAIISEVLRSFPDRDLSMAKYGPELAKFYTEVRRIWIKLPLGKLTVSTEPAGSMVFINEDFKGTSPVTVPKLRAGAYRIYIQNQQLRSRVHPLKLAGGASKVHVDLALDQAISTMGRVSLIYRDEGMRRAHQASHAARLARALGAKQAILVERATTHGQPVLGATLIDAKESRPLRAAYVAASPAETAGGGIKRLARFISTGRASKDLVVRLAPAAAPPVDRAGKSGGSPYGLLRWISLGVAVAGIAAGATLLALHGDKTCSTPEGVLCPETYDTLSGGAALTALGAAAAASAGVFFYLHGKNERPTSAASLAPFGTRGGAGVSAAVTW